MKQTVKKLLFMLGIMCLTIFGKETSTTVLADNLDEIENYTIYAEPDWEDGSVYLKYDITWKVLDSDTDGPLEWVKIGIPNSNVEEIEGYSSNIENIRYYKNGGSYVRIDFDRKYYEGETVEFSFGIHQHHLYETIDGMRAYRFTPGWFDEIVVDELNIYWKSDNIKYVLNGYWEQDDYYQFRTSLAEGEKYTVKIEYDADVFRTEDDKKITHPVGTGTKIVMAVMLLAVPGILLLLIIRAYKKGKPVDSYRAESGFGNAFTDIRTSSHYTGGRGSGGCACACACACAGGGRAGCSKKDFYGTKLTTMAIREALKDTAHEEI